MRKIIFTFIAGLAIIIVWSCGHKGNTKDLKEAENRIIQQEDGTLSMKLDEAATYSDLVDPSCNTAEWNVVISKPGGYKVWLTSATKDTIDLNYSNSVRISLSDDHLEVTPECDKIVKNADNVTSSYFIADSYMGSFYIPEPGEYNMQVISEKVIAKNNRTQNTSLADDIMLLSVHMTPMTN